MWRAASSGYVIALLLSAVAIAALSLPRGRIRETYGGWDRFIR